MLLEGTVHATHTLAESASVCGRPAGTEQGMTLRKALPTHAATLLATAGIAFGADSGMYRGPENNGVYPETGILRKAAWPHAAPESIPSRLLSRAGASRLP